LETEAPNLSDKQWQLAGKDIISAIVIISVGIAVSVWALGMPRPSGWPSAPGLVPLLFAGTMTLMGIALFISAFRKNGIGCLRAFLAEFSATGFFQDTHTKRSIWIIFLSAVYTLILTGRVPFEIAGSLFLVSTLSVFWRKGGWLKIILISVLTPFFFTVSFRFLFAMLLPGDSLIDFLFYR
jgi:hypothetical protein